MCFLTPSAPISCPFEFLNIGEVQKRSPDLECHLRNGVPKLCGSWEGWYWFGAWKWNSLPHCHRQQRGLELPSPLVIFHSLHIFLLWSGEVWKYFDAFYSPGYTTHKYKTYMIFYRKYSHICTSCSCEFHLYTFILYNEIYLHGGMHVRNNIIYISFIYMLKSRTIC